MEKNKIPQMTVTGDLIDTEEVVGSNPVVPSRVMTAGRIP